MSATYTYPGVYIQELPSPVHTIAAAATSIAAFVGFTANGIDNRAQQIFSFGDFQRLYGGLASNSEVSYAVAQFFQNGGSQACLNIHRRKSLTDLLGEEVGGEVWGRFTVHYTPTHGSWLNQAEIEIGILSRQCLGTRRIPNLKTLRKEVRAWNRRINRRDGRAWSIGARRAIARSEKSGPAPIRRQRCQH